MPQLRSFSSFGGTPGIGPAYLGGVKTATEAFDNSRQLELQRSKLAQDSFQAGRQLDFQRSKLAQEQVQANMEHQAQQQALAQRAMMQNQELAVQSAYQQSMIGLKERELGQDQQKLQMATEQAAQRFQAQESIRREVEAVTAKGGDENAAFRNAMMRHGITADAGAGAWSGSGGFNAQMGTPVAVDLNDEKGVATGQRIYQASPNRWAKVPDAIASRSESAPVPGTDGRRLQVGKQTFEAPAWTDAKALMKKRDALEAKIEGKDFTLQRNAFVKSKEPKADLSRADTFYADQYRSEAGRLAKFNADIERLSSSLTNAPAAQVPEGMGATTNSPIRIKSIRLKGQ